AARGAARGNRLSETVQCVSPARSARRSRRTRRGRRARRETAVRGRHLGPSHGDPAQAEILVTRRRGAGGVPLEAVLALTRALGVAELAEGEAAAERLGVALHGEGRGLTDEALVAGVGVLARVE